MPTGPTTLQTARDDLQAARVYASQARAAALQTTRIVRLCFRAQGKDSCAEQLDDAEEAAIRADAAAAQVSHVEMVVQHLLGAIAAFVAPVREQATHTFTARVEKAQTQFGEVREQRPRGSSGRPGDQPGPVVRCTFGLRQGARQGRYGGAEGG